VWILQGALGEGAAQLVVVARAAGDEVVVELVVVERVAAEMVAVVVA